MQQEFSWIHCYFCGVQMKGTSRNSSGLPQYDHPVINLEMHLTNCGHFFCQNCVSRAATRQCAACGASPVKTVKVGPDLKPDIQAMFQKASGKASKLSKALEFRQHQFKLLIELHLRNISKMENQLKQDLEEIRTRKDSVDQLESECEELRKELARKQIEAANRNSFNDSFTGEEGLNFSNHEQEHEPSAFGASRRFPGDGPEHPKQPHSPTFSNMPVNVFSCKTPAAFKHGLAVFEGPSGGEGDDSARKTLFFP